MDIELIVAITLMALSGASLFALLVISRPDHGEKSQAEQATESVYLQPETAQSELIAHRAETAHFNFEAGCDICREHSERMQLLESCCLFAGLDLVSRRSESKSRTS